MVLTCMIFRSGQSDEHTEPVHDWPAAPLVSRLSECGDIRNGGCAIGCISGIFVFFVVFMHDCSSELQSSLLYIDFG